MVDWFWDGSINDEGCNKTWSLYLPILLFLNQNIFCGYSKEPSQWDGSFEHPKNMFKLMDKKIITILHTHNLFVFTYDVYMVDWCLDGSFNDEDGNKTWSLYIPIL